MLYRMLSSKLLQRDVPSLIRICSFQSATVSDILDGKHIDGSKIHLKGWIKSIRKLKDNAFCDIDDGTGCRRLQLVIDKNLLQQIGYESSVDIKGTLERNAKSQLEIRVEQICELGGCPLILGYPFYPKKSYPPDYIRNHLHLRPRVATVGSAFRVRHRATQCFNEYLDREGFVQIHTPLITSNDCEGAGEAFLVKPANEALLKQMTKKNVPLDKGYFDREAYLTVSGQLHLEAMCHGLGKVFSFGPTFRAENSKSPIHLSEFYMLELEEAFMNSIDDLADRIESIIKTVSKRLLDTASGEVDAVRKLTTETSLEESFQWLNKPFPKISFAEAINILEKNSSKLKSSVQPADGINKEQELYLVNYFQSPVFVVRWPKEIKSFYMRQCPDDSNLVDALDLLVPHVGELVGGSVRENDYERLKAKLPDQEALGWYLQLRQFGSVPTAGFGLGLERYLCWILNVHNVRDVIPFPRWAHNCAM
ncbi:probable asparagine--tRNA ligase, mitochondrial [Uranotaenia lowii]|uniref:probable asparagine--tRNA ligase, mitochondrial n=1 Tax=Uranotaenia lowii TaxID=190385 RepID=UPI0024796926|nr:probable asparagine--tRNA ligase, mitochondrial [Uranotaenia lowii]